MNILVANIGSTSFKYRLYDRRQYRVGDGPGAHRAHRPAGRRLPRLRNRHPAVCAQDIAGEGRPLAALSELSAIGFKAVHAGPVGGARLVDDEVLAAMEEFAFFAPAHNPPYVAAMRSFRRALPGVPLVALFETAFFDPLDEAATTYAVPYAWQRGARRPPLRLPRRQPPRGQRARARGRRPAAPATSPVTSAAVRASPRSATASRSTPASACRRSRGCRRTTARATSTCSPRCS